jgi:hypothetical protein
LRNLNKQQRLHVFPADDNKPAMPFKLHDDEEAEDGISLRINA